MKVGIVGCGLVGSSGAYAIAPSLSKEEHNLLIKSADILWQAATGLQY